MGAAIEMKVPAKFFADHDERECVLHSGSAYIVRSTKTTVTVRLHPRDAHDLLNDAEFYSNTGCADQNRGLAASARATVRSIRARFTDDERSGWATFGTCDVLATDEWCPTCGKR
jgi:hypothetical protein